MFQAWSSPEINSRSPIHTNPSASYLLAGGRHKAHSTLVQRLLLLGVWAAPHKGLQTGADAQVLQQFCLCDGPPGSCTLGLHSLPAHNRRIRLGLYAL